jgi:geranylgeranyl diphosphate synthase, type I
VLTLDHPLDVEDLRVRTQKVLDQHLTHQARQLAPLGADIDPLLAAITDLVNRGKRLRTGFCYWGWRGADGDDGPAIVEAAAAFELFQAAALLHDDVMDDSDTRRGLTSVHRRFADVHREQGWAGDPVRFGESTAILAGDLCLSWSDELLSGCGLPAAAVARAKPMFDLMRTQLMGGQYLDVLGQVLPESAGGGSVERARQVIRFKSAKYSVEHPLVIGGLLAGAQPQVLASYSAYALPLGEAFQLRDDLLSVFGDPAQTGKPAGEDFREGKRTVLVAYALAEASASQAATLRAGLGRPDLDATGEAELRTILIDTGAVARVEALIVDLVEQARAAVATAEITPAAREVLTGLIRAATDRTS